MQGQPLRRCKTIRKIFGEDFLQRTFSFDVIKCKDAKESYYEKAHNNNIAGNCKLSDG